MKLKIQMQGFLLLLQTKKIKGQFEINFINIKNFKDF